MSRMTTSGSCASSAASASWPSRATRTSCPSSSSTAAMATAASWLSSTTRMRCGRAAADAPAAGRRSRRRLRRHHIGQRTLNSEPWSKPALTTSMSPPCNCASRRASVSPTPRPPCERSSPRLPCANRSKMRGSNSGSMPMPWSTTETTTRSCLEPRAARWRSPPGCTWTRCAAGWPPPASAAPRRRRATPDAAAVPRQALPAALDQAVHRLHALRDHRVQVQPLALQHDLALADARDVEQFLDQPRHLPQLAVGDVERPVHLRVRRGGAAHHLHRHLDRRQRVAQLVRHHREELVLAAVRLLQFLLRRHALLHLALQHAVEPHVLEGARGTRGDLLQQHRSGAPSTGSRHPARPGSRPARARPRSSGTAMNESSVASRRAWISSSAGEPAAGSRSGPHHAALARSRSRRPASRAAAGRGRLRAAAQVYDAPLRDGWTTTSASDWPKSGSVSCTTANAASSGISSSAHWFIATSACSEPLSMRLARARKAEHRSFSSAMRRAASAASTAALPSACAPDLARHAGRARRTRRPCCAGSPAPPATGCSRPRPANSPWPSAPRRHTR